MLQLLHRKIKCPETLRLIRKWLRCPISISGKLVKRRKGIPQGSPLSPLLSNIKLNELDIELESRGVKFIRYADDFSIYTKTKSEARQIGYASMLTIYKRISPQHNEPLYTRPVRTVV